MGRVVVKIRSASNSNALTDDHTKLFQGSGNDTDIVVASTKAYILALNRLQLHNNSTATVAAAAVARHELFGSVYL
jgi:hypothetical protein